MKAIVAVNKLGYIGLNGDLPWRCKNDLKHFKEKTMGQKLLLGRKTFESLPLLKGRELIVVGTGYNTLEDGLSQNPDWIIGGGKIYEQTLHLCDELHMSIIDDMTVGDTIFNMGDFRGKLYKYNFSL